MKKGSLIINLILILTIIGLIAIIALQFIDFRHYISK